MSRLTRRQALRSGAGILAVGLAGCSGDESDSPSDEDESTATMNDGESDTSSGEDGSGESGEMGGDVTESLVVGESYTNPIGNTLTVTGIEFQDTVEAESRFGDGELYQKEPQEGEQWAVVTVEIINDSGQTQYLTPLFEISVRADGTEYTNTAIQNEEDTYKPDEVQDGESRMGWIAYGVPAELTLADIEVVHSNSADGENWTVTWSEG